MTFEFERQMKTYKDLLDNAEKYEQSFRWEQAFNIYLNAEKIVKKYGSKTEIGNIYYRKGRVLAQKGNLKESLSAFKESLKFLKKSNAMPLQIAIVKGGIGNAYKSNGNITEALEAYQEAVKILKAEKERVLYTHSHLTNQILEAIAKQLNNVGEMNLILGNWDKALETCRESLNVAIDTKTSSTILTSRIAIAKIYSRKGDFKSALEYLMKSIDIAKQEKAELNLLKMFLEIGNIYNHEKDSKKALNFYKKALKLSKKLGNNQKEIEILDKIGTVFLKENSKKKALEFFNKGYEIAIETKQYYFDSILYHLGLLDYLNKDYDAAYEKLKESLKFAKKTNNKQLLFSLSLKIGDLLKIKENFDDSIYYYKKALEYTKNLRKEIKILNKIGLSHLLSNNLQDADDYFLRSFNWLRVLFLEESNSIKKQQLITKYSEIPLNLCALKSRLYQNTKNIELLKEALGYSEFMGIQKTSLNLQVKTNQIEKADQDKTQTQIRKQCSELKKLNIQFQQEKNIKAKEKILNKIDETQKILFLLDDSRWETGNLENGSFPQSLEKIIDKLLLVSRDISDSWAILDLIYVKDLKILYIFLIDIVHKELYLFSKQLDNKFTRTVQNKLEKLGDQKIKENPTQYGKLLNSVNNFWTKLFPTPFTNFLIKQNYGTLTIISQSFLSKLPWNTIKLKKQPLARLFPLKRGFSLNRLIHKK